MPTATTQPDGTATAGAGRHNPRPGVTSEVDDYYVSLGFAPGFEIAGRVVEGDYLATPIRDLSLSAKLRLWQFANGAAFAIGGQDIGGEQQLFRGAYAVGTLPWRSLAFTAGYGWGPDLLEGALGGIEWAPWPYFRVLAEYDGEEINGGLKLRSPPLFRGLTLGAIAGYTAADQEIAYGLQLSVPIGINDSARTIDAASSTAVNVGDVVRAGQFPVVPAAPGDAAAGTPAGTDLRAALLALGFEAVRTGTRPDGTRVVLLQNRRYNHSAADGIGVALAAIARAAPGPAELVLTAYGVPQLRVLADGAGGARSAAYVDRIPGREEIQWDAGGRAALDAIEVVVEPVLRTFVATEYGILDFGAGLRARATAALARGLLVNVGLQAPVARTGDFAPGNNFAPFAPKAGVDLAVLQYFHKPLPQWALLWSAGRMRIFRADRYVGALEQLWLSPAGRHQLRAKAMALQGRSDARAVALAGYTWFDPARRYAVGLTAGRFYAEDAGAQLDVSRHFGDTICTLFYKAASRDDQAAGIQISLPLTPRRDAAPGWIQVKGSPRWGHSLSSTVNDPGGANPLRPLLLYEPRLDLDLRRDLFDSGRLGEAYLQEQAPRLREAAALWLE